MQLKDNTILITGGGTGIGRGLAEAFHKLGNKIIIAGRREHPLHEVSAANPGIEYVPLDVSDRKQIDRVAQYVIEKFPGLNCLVNNAGIQRAVDFNSGVRSPDSIDAEVATNFTGLVHMCAVFLPPLRKQSRSALINVSSGLGLIPMSRVPVYAATKAAVHSFTRSLRHQLRGTSVEVIELIPPSVETELRAGRQEAHSGPGPMPLDQYISETMKSLEKGDAEVAVGTARFALAATSGEEVTRIFAMMNR